MPKLHFTRRAVWRTTLAALTRNASRERGLLLGSLALVVAVSCQNDRKSLVAPVLRGKAHIPISAATATTASGATSAEPESPIAWDGKGTNSDGTCKDFLDDPDLAPPAGAQGWLFILTSPDPDAIGSVLGATFSDGPGPTVPGSRKAGGSYHYIVYTTSGAALLSALATNGMTNSNLTVSHCESGSE